MVTRAVLESYGILLAGGGVLAAILLTAPKYPPREFRLSGNICDSEAVVRWLDRKLAEGKITNDDIQRLFLTPMTLSTWLPTVIGRHGFTSEDLSELAAVC